MTPDDAAFVPMLITGLSDSRPGVRWWCARGLGRIGPAAVAARPALERLAQEHVADPEFERQIQSYALHALATLDGVVTAADTPSDAGPTETAPTTRK